MAAVMCANFVAAALVTSGISGIRRVCYNAKVHASGTIQVIRMAH